MQTALLTEHLRFTPLSVIDDIINTINQLVQRAVDAADNGLNGTDPANLGFDRKAVAEGVIPDADADGHPLYPDAKKEIDEGVYQLETLLNGNVDRNFDKFELYILRSVLNVPEDLLPWIRLRHYENVPLSITNSTSETPSQEEVQNLENRLRQTRKLNLALHSEIRRNNTILERVRSLMNDVPSNLKTEPASNKQTSLDRTGAYTFLTNGQSAKALGMSAQPAPGSTHGPLLTNTSFVHSQLPALRALLDDLRAKVGDLGDAQAAASESHFSRERRLYLNNLSRKAVERQGVEIGGSSEGLGRRVQGDEVAALERIVEVLGDSCDRMEE